MPKVSFSVPVYNVSSYIEKCVRSLYEQTLDDIEIVLVDDGTPDDSIEIALRILEEYPNRKEQVRIVRHEHNLGIAETKKDCLLEARGEYIIVVDSDDYVDVRMSELLYNKAKKTDADMVVCDLFIVTKTEMKRRSVAPEGVERNGENIREDTLTRKAMPYMGCRMVRKKSLMRMNSYGQ